MEKLTASQVAMHLGLSVYTIKRWYAWYETEDKEKLDNLIKEGMPQLPEYMTVGSTKWRYWDKADLEKLKAFKEWMPHTRAGVMGSLNKKD